MMNTVMKGILSTWEGLHTYNTWTKILAIFAIVMLCLWLRSSWRQQGTFFAFSVVTFFLCLCPLTAYLLGIYQTAFYTYSWIWNLVPLLPMVAYGLTQYLISYWESKTQIKVEKILISIAIGFGLVLCIGLGRKVWNEENRSADMERAQRVLTICKEYQDKLEEPMLLWAPKEIVEYARFTCPEMKLYYGRDMWEEDLLFYTDDRYTECQIEDYQWMDFLGDIYSKGEESDYKGPRKTREALQFGVNAILFPTTTDQEVITSMEMRYRKKAVRIEEYYFFIFTRDEVVRLAK